jgi:hypothetical protein
MTPRPHSLAEVASRTREPLDFEYELADFLHEFASRARQDMLKEVPPLLSDRLPKGAVFDAYLAAVAAALSSQIGQPVPPWTRLGERYLPEPWFASNTQHMRALLLLESPSAFRERNLFVTANALSVA